MTFRMLLSLALQGLWRQKVRTALTLVGVTVGTCALAFSIALGLGLRAFIDTEFKGRDDFWRVVVFTEPPPPDEALIPPRDRPKIEVKFPMAADRKARVREALVELYATGAARRPPKPLDAAAVAAISDLPDVAQVRTFRQGTAWLSAPGTNNRPRSAVAVGPLDELAPRLLVGRLPAAPDANEAVVSELALYQLDQFGVGDDAQLDRVLGRTFSLEIGTNDELALASALLGQRPAEASATQTAALRKIRERFPEAVKAFGLTPEERADLLGLLDAQAGPREQFRTKPRTYAVCGVTRVFTREELKKTTPLESGELRASHVFLPAASGEAQFNELTQVRATGFLRADVRVRPGGDLVGLVAQIEGMGFRTFSGAKWFEGAKREVTLIAAGLNLFAFIALFVAAVGITNTLVTSVVERTKEIGVLRAIGATRGQVIGLFLTEGALIGAAGAVLGLVLARGLAAWADTWVHDLIAKQMGEQKLISTTIFVFPWWVWLGAVLFSVGVTTLAALYPARRAAAIHPIEALRYG